MPANIDFHEDEGVVVVTLEGDMDDDAVTSAFRSLADDPRMKSEYHLLVDVRPMTPGPFSSPGIRSVASMPSPVARESRRAVLVSTDYGFGMSRMFNLNIADENFAFTIFRDEDEARRFVGLPPSE